MARAMATPEASAERNLDNLQIQLHSVPLTGA